MSPASPSSEASAKRRTVLMAAAALGNDVTNYVAKRNLSIQCGNGKGTLCLLRVTAKDDKLEDDVRQEHLKDSKSTISAIERRRIGSRRRHSRFAYILVAAFLLILVFVPSIDAKAGEGRKMMKKPKPGADSKPPVADEKRKPATKPREDEDGNKKKGKKDKSNEKREDSPKEKKNDKELNSTGDDKESKHKDDVDDERKEERGGENDQKAKETGDDVDDERKEERDGGKNDRKSEKKCDDVDDERKDERDGGKDDRKSKEKGDDDDDEDERDGGKNDRKSKEKGDDVDDDEDERDGGKNDRKSKEKGDDDDDDKDERDGSKNDRKSKETGDDVDDERKEEHDGGKNDQKAKEKGDDVDDERKEERDGVENDPKSKETGDDVDDERKEERDGGENDPKSKIKGGNDDDDEKKDKTEEDREEDIPEKKPREHPTDSPTPDPTSSPPPPTRDPTKSPTKAPDTPPPSREPTDSPPKADPTKSPTKALETAPPTRDPTKSPTKPPETAPPTRDPTKSPMKAPDSTRSPTKAPETGPPTREPTKSSDEQTKPATRDPTKPPTRAPETDPLTHEPTKSPDEQTKPSSQSTRPPSTGSLTKTPSESVTSPPTESPTRPPSLVTTSPPTRLPTSQSHSPTKEPTKLPISVSGPDVAEDLTHQCGNGSIEDGEECDPMYGSIDAAGGCYEKYRRARFGKLSCVNCKCIGCGNGKLDGDEECDKDLEKRGMPLEGTCSSDQRCNRNCRCKEMHAHPFPVPTAPPTSRSTPPPSPPGEIPSGGLPGSSTGSPVFSPPTSLPPREKPDGPDDPNMPTSAGDSTGSPVFSPPTSLPPRENPDGPDDPNMPTSAGSSTGSPVFSPPSLPPRENPDGTDDPNMPTSAGSSTGSPVFSPPSLPPRENPDGTDDPNMPTSQAPFPSPIPPRENPDGPERPSPVPPSSPDAPASMARPSLRPTPLLISPKAPPSAPPGASPAPVFQVIWVTSDPTGRPTVQESNVDGDRPTPYPAQPSLPLSEPTQSLTQPQSPSTPLSSSKPSTTPPSEPNSFPRPTSVVSPPPPPPTFFSPSSPVAWPVWDSVLGSSAPSLEPSLLPEPTVMDVSSLPIQGWQASGAIMLLGDVQPLDENAERLWTAISGEYFTNEITQVVGERLLEKVEVSVRLSQQNPPFRASTQITRGAGYRHRFLQNTEQDFTGGDLEGIEQELTFQVLILLQSVVTVHGDVNRYIVGALDEQEEKLAYLLDLRNTGHPAFANASSVAIMGATTVKSLDDPDNVIKPTTGTSSNDLRRNGLAAGLTVVAFVGMSLAVFFFIKGRRHRNMAVEPPHSRQQNDTCREGFDPSHIEVGTRTEVSSLGDPFPPDIRDISSTTDSKSATKSSGTPTLEYDFVQEFRRSTHNAVYWNDLQNDTNSASLVTKDDNTLEAEYFRLVRFEVEAPSGRLGIVLETSNGGAPVVQAISESSPLAGQIREGDTLLTVDGVDVTDMTASDVSNLISSKQANSVRKFVFAMSPRMEYEASLEE